MTKLCKIIPIIALIIALNACANEPSSLSELPLISNSLEGFTSASTTSGEKSSDTKMESTVSSTSSTNSSSTTENEPLAKKNLGMLDIDYIDMMMLHHPGTNDVKAYKAMEKYVERGKIRSLGLSNWYVEELNASGIETELIQLDGDVIQPCKACRACGDKGNCVHSADNFRDLFDKMKNADGIILGSPVYCANISANMQALLERAAVVADMNPELFKHKIGMAVAAARHGGALNTIDAMNHFFLVQEMYVVGSSYWGMAYGRMPGEVEQDSEGMETIKTLAQNMAHLLKALNERRS